MTIDPDSLLRQAHELARFDQQGRPQQINLRRAVSAVYYGLFHYLVDKATLWMMGTDPQRRPYRDVLARAFVHSEMADACKSFSGGTLPHGASPASLSIPPAVKHIAATFMDAQDKRHLADYDRSASFTRGDVLVLAQNTGQAIEQFQEIENTAEAGFFLMCLLSWGRLRKRA